MKVFFSLEFLSLHKQNYFLTVQGTHCLAFAQVLGRVKDLMYNLHSFRLCLIFSPLARWRSVLINPLSKGKLSGKCNAPDLPISDTPHSSLEGDLFPPQDGKAEWESRLTATAQDCKKGSAPLSKASKFKIGIQHLGLLSIAAVNTTRRRLLFGLLVLFTIHHRRKPPPFFSNS